MINGEKGKQIRDSFASQNHFKDPTKHSIQHEMK